MSEIDDLGNLFLRPEGRQRKVGEEERRRDMKTLYRMKDFFNDQKPINSLFPLTLHNGSVWEGIKWCCSACGNEAEDQYYRGIVNIIDDGFELRGVAFCQKCNSWANPVTHLIVENGQSTMKNVNPTGVSGFDRPTRNLDL